MRVSILPAIIQLNGALVYVNGGGIKIVRFHPVVVGSNANMCVASVGGLTSVALSPC